MRNSFVLIIIVAILGGAWLLFLGNRNTETKNIPQRENTEVRNEDDELRDSKTNARNEKSDQKSAEIIPENTILIKDYQYSRATLTVKEGTTVTWINRDEDTHTATGDALTALESPYMKQGESYSYTFDTVGTFPYHCSPHPYMKATVVVTE